MGSSNKLDTLFERFYKFLAVAAVTLTISPIFNFAFFSSLRIPMSGALCLITSSALVCIGYFLQAFFGKVTKVKRKSSEGAYEHIVRYFRPEHSALPIAISAVLSVISGTLINSYMIYRANAGIDPYYDKGTVYPFVGMFFTALFLIVGIMMWFYPYDRIISFKSLFAFLGVFMMTFMLANLSSGGNIAYLTFCLVLFLLSALIVMNQSYIVGLLNRTKIGLITPNVRIYNMLFIAVFVAVIVAAFIVMAAITVGIMVLFRIMLYFTLASVFRDESSAYVKPQEAAESFNEQVFNMSAIGLSERDTGGMLFAIFTVLIVGTILYFTVLRKSGILKNILSFLSNLLNNIVAFLSNLLYFNFGSKDEQMHIVRNYKDETTKVQDKVISGKIVKSDGSTRITYRDFTHRLNSLKTQNERLVYAYSVLVNCWCAMNYGVHNSDTPREVQEKILYKTSVGEDVMNDITAVFEQYKYAENEVESGNALNSICKLIEKCLV